MKKRRNNPIALLIAMFLCFGLIGYLNSRASGDGKSPQQQQQQQPTNAEPSKDLGPQTQAPSKDALKSMTSTGPTSGPIAPTRVPGGPGGPAGGPPGRMGGPPGGPPGMPPGAHMPVHPGKPPRPHPSDSSIGSGWYMPEANSSFDH